MNASNRRSRTSGRLALALATLAIAPFGARAAVAAPVIQVVADRISDNPATAYDDRYVLFANSSPYGAGTPGVLHVSGSSTPGSRVLLTATDDLGGSLTKIIQTGTTSDGVGFPPGQFDANLEVSDLGRHFAGPDGSCGEIPRPDTCDPTSPDPNNWGPSTITVTAQAITASGSSDVVGAPPVVKYAGTPGDTYAPRFGTTADHGGTAVDPKPDTHWPPCHWFHSIPADVCMQGVRQYENGHSVASIRGSATDDNTILGIYSEIGDIRITITKDDEPVASFSSIHRVGGWGYYSQTVPIDMFVPNPPPSPQYVARVDVVDAWGSVDIFGDPTSSSAQFRVYPV